MRYQNSQRKLLEMLYYRTVQKSPYIGRQTAMELNRKHSKHITHDTVSKLIEKFKNTGSVADQPRSGIHEHPP
jgi:hypothetical protein